MAYAAEGQAFALGGSGSLNDGAWHHLVATADPAAQVAQLYVDGLLDASTSFTDVVAGPYASVIGFLSATVDEVAIYRKVLTSAEIAVTSSTGYLLAAGVAASRTRWQNPWIVPREGTLTVAGLPIQVTQGGRDCFSVSPQTVSLSASGGSGSLGVSALESSCGWTAGSDAAWLALDTASGSGAGQVIYTAAANTTAIVRTAHATIAGHTITVTQAGAAPVRPGLRYFVAVGGQHSLALKNDGTVWSWGFNDGGQLGDGTATTRYEPRLVSSLTNIVTVSAGASHSIALKSDGTVWTWASNTFGQIGDGTIDTQRRTPVQVTSLANIIAITAGSEYNLALKGDGTVWSWGRNTLNQLGDGSSTNRVTPVQVSGLSLPTIAIAAAGAHSLIVDNTGSMWAFGIEIGSVPIRVSPLPALISRAGASSGASWTDARGGHVGVESEHPGSGWRWHDDAPPGACESFSDRFHRTDRGRFVAYAGAAN